MRSAKTFIACTLVLVLTTFAACSKPRSDSGQEDSSDGTDAKGVVLAQGAAFYRGGNPDALEWTAALDFGVTFRTKAQASMHLVNGESLLLMAVELPAESAGLNGSGSITGWIRESQVAIGKADDMSAGVVVGKTVQGYDRKVQPTGMFLQRMTLVSSRHVQSLDSYRIVSVYDYVADAKTEYLVTEKNLSFKEDDIKAAVLVQKAKMARDEAEKRAILEDAERSFGSLEFGDEIRSMLVGVEATAEDEDSFETEDLVATLTVKETGAQVFEEPSLEAGLIATLYQDDEVSVVSRTAQQYEIDGNLARWYKIEAPSEGWVFGGFLEGAD